MPLRDLVLSNLRWKVTALLLAMVVWFSIKLNLYNKGSSQTLRRQPILVLKAPDDPRVFQLQPPEADLMIQATKQLEREDLEVFVNVTGMPMDVTNVYRPVLVRGADTLKVIRIDPFAIRVERITPPALALTNTLRKP